MEKTTSYVRTVVAALLFSALSATAYAEKQPVEKSDNGRPVLVEGYVSSVDPTPLKLKTNIPTRAGVEQYDILIDEDFSAFATGTVDVPDTTKYLASQSEEPGIYIDPSLTKDGTWAGDYVYSAGGAACLKTITPYMPAMLFTPLGDYSGDLTISCKVKALPNWIVAGTDPDTDELVYSWMTGSSLKIITCVGGYTDHLYADTDLEGSEYSTRLYPGQGWTVVNLTLKNYSADNDGCICFYTDGCVIIDEIRITAGTSFIAAPKVIGVTDFQADNITVSWEPVRKAQNYYVDLYKWTGSDYERVWGDMSIDYGEGDDYTCYDYTDGQQTSYTFTGLDPETEYYYAVRAHYLDVFSTSAMYHAFGVCTPEALPATEIDSRGAFTANWNTVPKATSYTVSLYGLYEAAEDVDGYVLLEDDFNQIDGSMTTVTDPMHPEALGNYEGESLDAYTARPGWTGYGNAVAEGMFGCESASYFDTYLVTPDLYVANGDEVLITMKAYGNDGDRLVLEVDGRMYMIPFSPAGDGTGYIDGVFSLPVETETMRVKMYTYNYGVVMFDEIRFSQNLKKGAVVKTMLRSGETPADVQSYTFDNLADYGYVTFGYDVVSNFEYNDETAVSKPSSLVTVNLETGATTAISSAVDSVSPTEAEVVARYSLDGRRLDAPQRGVNILKMSDGSTRKVIVK